MFEQTLKHQRSRQHYSQQPKGGDTELSITDERINEMWSIHATEYYSAIKRNEVLPHAATWVDLEKQGERNQTQSHRSYDSIYIKCLQRGKSIETGSRSAVGQGCGGVTANGYGISFLGDKNILTLHSGVGCTAL